MKSNSYLRDKQQREVDFIVIRDQQPWFLVEVKHANDRLSPTLLPKSNKIDARFPTRHRPQFRIHQPLLPPAVHPSPRTDAAKPVTLKYQDGSNKNGRDQEENGG